MPLIAVIYRRFDVPVQYAFPVYVLYRRAQLTEPIPYLE